MTASGLAASISNDELGRLILIKAYDDEHPEGNERAYTYYNYDSDGSCRVKHGFELVE